jgi:CPA2 family monovalent cation:H+ antiporter-2
MLYDILVFLIAAVVIVPVFRHMRTSPILGYLAAGILVGPHGLALIQDTEAANSMAEFGVVFLLFMIGLELSVERLRALSRYVFGLGALQVVITAILIGCASWVLGASGEAALIIGGGLALSSTAFVLQLLNENRERSTEHGNVAFAVLLFQDLAIVPLLMLVTLLGEGGDSFLTVLGMALIKAALALVLVIVIGRRILRPIYRIIAETRSSELFVATTLLVVLGIGWLMSLVGISMVLGAFLAGLLLSETEYKHQVEADIRPFRGILLGLFFITVGMSIDMTLIKNEFLLVSMIVISLMVGKTVVIAILCRAFGLKTASSLRVGLLLSQGGEFGFVLFLAASSYDILALNTAQILLASITLTMIATPLMIYIGNLITVRLARGEELPVAGVDEINHEVMHGHVVIAGFGRVGQTIAKALSMGGVSYVALDMDSARVRRCRSNGMPVFFGDASQIDVLNAAGALHAKGAIVTIDQTAAADHIVSALHEFAPTLPIFVRASDLAHGRRLEEGGATQAVPETLEASLQLGAIAMTSIGVNSDEIQTIIQELRTDDYSNMEKLELL